MLANLSQHTAAFCESQAESTLELHLGSEVLEFVNFQIPTARQPFQTAVSLCHVESCISATSSWLSNVVVLLEPAIVAV